MRFNILDAAPARLGECPIWCERSKRLWWIDVLSPALWSHDATSGVCTRYPVEARRIGSLALRRTSGLILACDNGLFSYDPETRVQILLVDPEPGLSNHRKNDGRADSAGNFWIGTLREDDYAPVGSIYRVTPKLEVTRQVARLAIPNSLAFDPEHRRVYYADTRAYTIWFRDYDPISGQMGEELPFATTAAPARPDGSCIDAEGHLWNAEYAGNRLMRYHPSGEVSRVIELPVSHPTCCCFGGDALDRLYITSASEPLSAEERQAEGLAGRVLVLDVGIKGRPEFRVGF